MGWRIIARSLALLGLLSAGCSHPCFVTEADFHQSLACGLETLQEAAPRLPARPVIDALTLAAPTTVDNPEQPARHLTLCEAISLALENGKVGLQTPVTPGQPLST